jgi:hypothetical protein
MTQYKDARQGPNITTALGDMSITLKFERPEDIFKWTDQELRDMMSAAQDQFFRNLRAFWGGV